MQKEARLLQSTGVLDAVRANEYDCATPQEFSKESELLADNNQLKGLSYNLMTGLSLLVSFLHAKMQTLAICSKICLTCDVLQKKG